MAAHVKCSNCSPGKGETYCVDCKKVLCRFCVTLLHHPDTKSEKHSIEEVATTHHGVKIITPILLDLLLGGAALFVLSGSHIGPDYFKGLSYCPAVSRGRWWLANLDANVFFYYKQSLATWCDWEDSYWRFFIDTWIRGIVTGTDSWLLIVSEGFKAKVFQEIARVLISPVVGVLYAVVASIFWVLEMQLTHVINRTGNEHHWVYLVQKAVLRLSFAETLRINDKKPPPPPTLRRKRPMTDYVEFMRYLYERHTRLLWFYKGQAQAVCEAVLRGTLQVTCILRIFCMFAGGHNVLFVARMCGLGRMAELHEAWFTDATGIRVHSQNLVPTDWFFTVGGHKVLAAVPSVADFFAGVGKDFAKGLWIASSPLLARLLLPTLALLPLPLLLWLKVRRQRKSFDKVWKTHHRQEVWGEMSRDNPCGGTAWKEVRFSNL